MERQRQYSWTRPEASGKGSRAWEKALERAEVPEESEEREEKEEANPASTYAPGQGPAKRLIEKYGGAPWIPAGRRYEPGSIGLHEEILDFVQWSKPTPHEFQVRMDVFKALEALIHREWPQAKVDYFGSFRTGLFLPISDIDMVVMGEWEGYPLWTLEAALRESGLVLPGSIKVLDKASVPIVKLTHAASNIHVDISFNMTNGVPSAGLIAEYMSTFPVLSYLVFVLKYYLLQRDLNEVFTGGLSSYSLILMTISFLQLHAVRRLQAELPSPRQTNLAVLLLEWLELYGRHFNYVSTAIRLRPQPSYAPKEELQREMPNGHRPSMLSIQDPLQPSNDIGRSCHGAMRVRQAFEYAFLNLSRALAAPSPHHSSHPSGSLLTRIIRVTDAVVDYRLFLASLPLASPASTSYAAVASSHLAAQLPRKKKSTGTPPSHGNGELSSEMSSDSDSAESTSQSSDASVASRRSYSSVASSNLPKAKPALPTPPTRPPKPPSPAPSTDSTRSSTGHRNAYRSRRRQTKPSPRRGGKRSS